MEEAVGHELGLGEFVLGRAGHIWLEVILHPHYIRQPCCFAFAYSWLVERSLSCKDFYSTISLKHGRFIACSRYCATAAERFRG